MTIYGIRHKETKEPLRISIFSNEGGDFCNSCGALFEVSFNENFYFVAEERTAQRALKEDPNWYNASLEHPQWFRGFDPNHYEVFSVSF